MKPPIFGASAQHFPVQLKMLKELISPVIQRQNTSYWDCVSKGEQLIRVFFSH